MEEKELCARCWAEISKNALFCSTCGHIHINNNIIGTKTTADYDPGNKYRKPWKETVILGNNSWKDKDSKDSTPNYIPWKPVMNQSRVNVKKMKGKPSQIPSPGDSTPSNELQAKGDQNNNRKQLERINSKRVVLFRGRLWSKSGDTYRKKKTIFNPDMIYGYEPKVNRYFNDESNEESIPPLSLYPLGIYSLDWVKTEKSSINVHVTLLRRSFHSKYHHSLSAHWLRIGYEVESLDKEKEEHERQFCALAYLPNCLAKCMGASIPGGWVDLKYVRSDY